MSALNEMKQIAPELWVCPQLQADDFAEVAKKGFHTVINARPDNEAPGQPAADDLRLAAQHAGLRYEYLPVIPNQITDQNVADFTKHLAELPGPILAFCRTGNRCANLWSLIQARKLC